MPGEAEGCGTCKGLGFVDEGGSVEPAAPGPEAWWRDVLEAFGWVERFGPAAAMEVIAAGMDLAAVGERPEFDPLFVELLGVWLGERAALERAEMERTQ